MNNQEYFKSYFESNQKHLQDNYPGISIERLLDEFLMFCNSTSVNYKREAMVPELHKPFWDKLEAGLPLEYINHNSYFYRSNFFINEAVLIPRSETEILVENSISYIQNNYHNDFRIAEVGTGSFCIGLSIAIDIKKQLDIQAGDISLDALEISTLNYFRMKNKIHPETKIQLFQSDRLNSFSGKFDFIVSNPPYIKRVDARSGVHVQVQKFEPDIALYLEDASYENWFSDFFSSAALMILAGGAFFMEGHEDTLKGLGELAKKHFSEVKILKDYSGRDRFIHCFKSK